jgi:hypothetical protein
MTCLVCQQAPARSQSIGRLLYQAGARQGGPVMAEAIAERVRRYILDGSDEDLRRLLGVAESTREMARSAFRRVGMQEGWHGP